MGTRMIRGGWLESKRIAQLDGDAERFFLRLCLSADDTARFTGDICLLKSYLFPRSTNLATRSIKSWLRTCVEAELVKPYEVDGKPYLYIPRFKQRLRIKRSRYPAPPWKTDDDDTEQPDALPIPAPLYKPEKKSCKPKRQRSDPKIRDAARKAYIRKDLEAALEKAKQAREQNKAGFLEHKKLFDEIEKAKQAGESSEWILRLESRLHSSRPYRDAFLEADNTITRINHELTELCQTPTTPITPAQ